MCFAHLMPSESGPLQQVKCKVSSLCHIQTTTNNIYICIYLYPYPHLSH